MSNRNSTSAKGKIIAGYDQLEHMIEGTPIRDFGVGPWTQPDPVDVINPFDFPTPGDGNFDGRNTSAMQGDDRMQVSGLDRDRCDKDQFMVNMNEANSCFDEPSKGGLTYGKNNTGDY